MARHRIKDFGLPERVYLRRGTYYYVCPVSGTWKSLGRTMQDVDVGLASLGVSKAVMPIGHLGVIYTYCKRNAKARGIAFDLTRADLAAMWARCRGRCELTGIKLDVLRVTGCKRRPMAPSIDRIDSRAGYAPGNCRLVCVAVNLAVNEWGDDLFARIAKGYLRRSAR